MSEPQNNPQNQEHKHTKHKRMVLKRIKKYRLKENKKPVFSKSLEMAFKEFDSSSEEFNAEEVLNANQSILNRIYDMLEIDEPTREMCKELNTMQFPIPEQFRMEEGSDIPSAGSLPQLILYLTHPDLNQKTFHVDFITTLTSFTKVNVVLAAIFTRFFADPNQPGANITQDKLKILQQRIIGLFHSVWERYVSYQLMDPKILNVLQYFAENAKCQGNLKKVLQATIDHLKGMKGGVTVLTANYQPSIPKTPQEKWTLLDIPDIEIARQLTYFHSELFVKITPMDLLQAAWGKKTGFKAQTIEAMTNHFNDFSAFVSCSILRGSKDPHARGRIIKRWIDIAWMCLNPTETDPAPHMHLINYHGVFAILYGLTHRSITRMQQTQKFAQRTNKNRAAHYEEMKKLTDISNGFKNYREVVKNKSDCIPFMGAFQKDLVYITEFFPNEVDGLINFNKCHEANALIKWVRSLQNHSQIKSIPRIQELIGDIPHGFDTMELMKESQRIEPPKN